MLKYLRGLVIVAFLMPCGLYAATSTLPKSGQTGCWDSSGNSIPCGTTGQDGAKLKGVAWPTPRFTNPDGSTPVNGDIAVDQLTGLIWTTSISAPTFTWQDALDEIAYTMNGAGGMFGYSDWRMPNRQELGSVIDYQQADTLPAGHPFTNVPLASNIWSSTTADYSMPLYLWDMRNMAWVLKLPGGVSSDKPDGGLTTHVKDTADSAYWPVRGGQFGNSVVSVLPASKDFVVETTGTTATQQFTIANTAAAGSSNLAVNSIILSGANKDQFSVNVGDGTGGTCGSYAPVVAAGGNCTFTVSFTPTSSGAKSASIRVSGSDVNTPNVDLALTGGVGLSVSASVAGGHGAITSTNPVYPVSGGTASFTLAPDGGYRPSSTVAGTCPPGSFTGLTYTTGAITTSCNVVFSFNAAPNVVINGGALYTNSANVTLALSASPTPAFMSFQVNGKSWSKPEPFATSKSIALKPATNGLRTVNVRYLKSLTDTSPVTASSTITLDTKKPTGKIVINGGAKTTSSTSVTLTLTAVDVTSGVESMQFSNDKTTWTDWEAFAGTKSYELPPGAGTKKVYVQYRDRAGNVSKAYSDTIKYVPAP